MKRIIPLVLTLCALLACMVVPASAVELDGVADVYVPFAEPSAWFSVVNKNGDKILFVFDINSQSEATVEFYTSGSYCYFRVTVPNDAEGVPPDVHVYYYSTANQLINELPRTTMVGSDDTIYSYSFWNSMSSINFNATNPGLTFELPSNSTYSWHNVYFEGNVDFKTYLESIQNQLSQGNTFLSGISQTLVNTYNWLAMTLDSVLHSIENTLTDISGDVYDLRFGVESWLESVRAEIEKLNGDLDTWIEGFRSSMENCFEEVYFWFSDLYDLADTSWTDINAKLDTIINGTQDFQQAVEDAGNKADDLQDSFGSAQESEDQIMNDGLGQLDQLPDELSSPPAVLNNYSGTHYFVDTVLTNPFVEPFLQLACIFVIISAAFSGRWWKEA